MAKNSADLSVKVENTCSETILKCGKTAEFSVEIRKDGELLKKGECNVALSNDGGTLLKEYKYNLADGNPFKVTGTMNTPSFFKCQVDMDKASDASSAAFEPEKIVPGLPCPDDFDKFWADSVKRQEAVPNPVRLIPMPQSGNKKCEAFKIEVSTPDNEKIYGYMTVPRKDGKFPVIVNVPGASKLVNAPIFRPEGSIIYVVMNVHRLDPSTDPKEWQAQKKAIRPLRYAGLPDREKYYYRNSILAVNAVINYMTSYPRWDGKHLVFDGASQGGGFALFMGGINKHLTAVVSRISAMCDHGGCLAGRSSGWPLLYMQAAADDKEQKDKILKMSAYFDGVNFAGRIKVPALVAVGFKDITCSPGSVYAAYNSINSEKKIITDVQAGHGISREYSKQIDEWLKPRLGLE
ncbi:MAG: hypothetical protein A2017_08335 [Lentisphaerae bacterium GWF2_44_16]|nr:MAG: hypothetical protein A2017_08335 [Lentisphaerae bacterium GWF2_44_16]